ncbi:MAG: transcriptional repressor, partial [Anaerolineales bacterium]|nr:transcriptional repressor [Anaerolineales bacterium]
GAAHYILMAGGHHHHLVCSVCHQVIEFDDCVLGEIERLICDRYHFQMQSHLLELYGRCPNCQ